MVTAVVRSSCIVSVPPPPRSQLVTAQGVLGCHGCLQLAHHEPRSRQFAAVDAVVAAIAAVIARLLKPAKSASCLLWRRESSKAAACLMVWRIARSLAHVLGLALAVRSAVERRVCVRNAIVAMRGA